LAGAGDGSPEPRRGDGLARKKKTPPGGGFRGGRAGRVNPGGRGATVSRSRGGRGQAGGEGRRPIFFRKAGGGKL